MLFYIDYVSDFLKCTQYPWVGAAVGIIVSITAIVADQVILQGDAYIAHPVVKVT